MASFTRRDVLMLGLLGLGLGWFGSRHFARTGNAALPLAGGGGTPEPELDRLVVDTGPVDVGARKAGDLLLADVPAPFYPAGYRIRDKTLPGMEFYVSADTEVVAPVAGEVTAASQASDGGDHYVQLEPEGAPEWTVDVDHLASPRVQAGETVAPGDILGAPGTWRREGQPVQGRTELLVSTPSSTGEAVSYCPVALLRDGARETAAAELAEVMDAWEDLAGDDAVYDQDGQFVAGCVSEWV